jgi:WD40 repeat protein
LPVSLWELESGRFVRNFPAKQAIATGSQAVMFSPDGKILATGGFRQGKVSLWDLSTGKIIRELGGGEGMVLSLVYSPDGKSLAAATTNAGIMLWEVSTGKQLGNWSGGPIWNLAFTPDGEGLVWYFGNKIVLQPIESRLILR